MTGAQHNGLVMQWIEDAPFHLQAKAVELARALVVREPDNVRGRIVLAETLLDHGQIDEALACLDDAAARFPVNAQLRYCQARAFEERGDFERALQALEAALENAPDYRRARILHCRLQFKLLPKGSALKVFDGVRALAEHDCEFAGLHLRALYRDGALHELLTQCGRYLAKFPGDSTITYFNAVALALMGRNDEARSALPLDRFVDIAILPVPAGFAGGEEFRAALAAEIGRNVNFVPDPRGKATRDGLLTRHLRGPDIPALDALLVQIKRQVEAYSARLGEGHDGFVKARPTKAKLQAWAVVSEAEGRQVSHHHPSGWLSGVFYVAAPRLNEASAFQGPLVLGALDKTGTDPPWGEREIEPVPGRIVLFPSYTPHATIPPGIGGRRIVVAFDVVPYRRARNSDAAVRPA